MFKKLAVLMLACGICISASAQFFDTEHPKVNKPVLSVVRLTNNVVVSASTMCIGGYLFAVATQDNKTSNSASSGVSLVQIFQANKVHIPPQPIPCVEGK